MVTSPKSVKKGVHPNSLKNLKPFPKGVNGNPHPGYSLKSRLQDILRSPKMPPDTCVGDMIVRATIEGALECLPAPLREVWDRTEGKVPGDAPAQVNVVIIKEVEVRLS